MSNKTTDTPRTDEQIWTAFHHHEMCDVVDKDFARQLERELNELWSRFDKQMEAEAEVERLKRPYGCKCQTLRERALGDGCDECNKALVIEMLTDERDELEAEVERLEANLKRAIEIAERLRSKIFTDGWLDEDDELYQIKATLNPTDK